MPIKTINCKYQKVWKIAKCNSPTIFHKIIFKKEFNIKTYFKSSSFIVTHNWVDNMILIWDDNLEIYLSKNILMISLQYSLPARANASSVRSAKRKPLNYVFYNCNYDISWTGTNCTWLTHLGTCHLITGCIFQYAILLH